MLEAFTTHELLSNIPVQIESICTYEDRLLVGTKQGTLLVYKFENDKIDLFLTLKGFSKKTINQIAVTTVFSPYQLIALSEGNLNVYSIQQSSIQLLPCEGLTKTRGSTLFSLHQSSAADEMPSAQLAVASKRKIVLYHWLKKGPPQEVKEINLYDVPKAVVFHGHGYSDKIYIGFKGKYCQLNVSSEQVKDMLCTGRQLEATMLWVDKDTVAICKDEWSILLGEDGKPYQDEYKSNIKWCDCPTALLYSKPYIAAVINKGIEVKTIQLVDPIQIIELPKVKLVAQDKRMFVASATHLWELKLNDLVYQVDKLITLKQFELAEALNKMSHEGGGDQEHASRQRTVINTQAAYHEFINKRYEKSMSRFQKSNVEVANVIGLFPDLLSKKMQDKQQYPPEIVEARNYLTTKDIETGLEALEKYLVAKRFDLNKYEEEVSNSKQTKIIIDTTLLKCYLQNKPKMVASLLRLKDNECHTVESERALKRARRMNDIIILYKSKGMHEKALTVLKQYANMQNTQKHELGGPEHTIKYLQDLGPEDIDLIKEYSKWVIEKHPDRCLDIFTDPSTVHSLPKEQVVQHLKSLNPDIALQYLERLIDIWNVSSQEIENSLITLLVEKVSSEWPAYQGMLAAGVVAPCAPGSEPGQLGTLRLRLTHFLERLQNYSPATVIQSLGYEIPLYQELAILYGRQKECDKALMLYCHVLKDRAKAEEFCSKYYETDKEVYYKLLRMYQCPKSLEALRLDKFKLEEPKADMGAAIDILVRHYKYIDVKENTSGLADGPKEFASSVVNVKLKALRLLPEDTKLQDVEEFMCAILRDRTKDSRRNLLLKSLNLSDNLKVKSQKMFYQKDKLIVTAMDSCAVCNKRVGECAIAFYPDRRIVHYGCMSRDVQPDTSS